MDIGHMGYWGPKYSIFGHLMRVFVFKRKYNVPLKLFSLFLVHVAHKFCSLMVFFHETPPQWPFPGENVTSGRFH